MKKTLFLLAILALVSCKKTSEDPKPSEPKNSTVTIGIKPSNSNGTYLHIKADHPFNAYGQASANTADSSYLDYFISYPGSGYSCTFRTGDSVYISCTEQGVNLIVQQKNDYYNFTYSQKFTYNFVVQ